MPMPSPSHDHTAAADDRDEQAADTARAEAPGDVTSAARREPRPLASRAFLSGLLTGLAFSVVIWILLGLLIWRLF